MLVSHETGVYSLACKPKHKYTRSIIESSKTCQKQQDLSLPVKGLLKFGIGNKRIRGFYVR